MAGIGIELKKIVSRQGYFSLIQAYSYAGLISSGPWLIAVCSLAFLGLILNATVQAPETSLFFVSVSTIYALTLVATGPLQMVLTRLAADHEFENNQKRIFPTFITCLSWVSATTALIALYVFYQWVPAPVLFKSSAALFAVLVASTWICSTFLTALKNYRTIVFAFLIGSISAVALSWLLTRPLGISGAMLGFAIGHGILLFLLIRSIVIELGTWETSGVSLCRSTLTHWQLALAGLMYNLGVWIDKILYWWLDPNSLQVAGVLHASPLYDRVVYFALLSIVPGMAVFLLKLETEFAATIRDFYQTIVDKGTLEEITQAKVTMIATLKEGFTTLFKVQSIITGLLILFSGRITQFFGFDSEQAGIMPSVLIGVFLLIIFLAMLTVLYYLDKRREAMICCTTFAAVNFLVTYYGIVADYYWYGVGFLSAALAGIVLAFSWINREMSQLEYFTFTRQPIYGADSE